DGAGRSGSRPRSRRSGGTTAAGRATARRACAPARSERAAGTGRGGRAAPSHGRGRLARPRRSARDRRQDDQDALVGGLLEVVVEDAAGGQRLDLVALPRRQLARGQRRLGRRKRLRERYPELALERGPRQEDGPVEERARLRDACGRWQEGEDVVRLRQVVEGVEGEFECLAAGELAADERRGTRDRAVRACADELVEDPRLRERDVDPLLPDA